MDSALDGTDGGGTSLLGRALTLDEAALAATKPIHSLPLARSLLTAFAERGYKSVADLLNASGTASFGPIRARRIRLAILSVLMGEFSLAGLGEASLGDLPARIDALLGRLNERRRTIIRGKYGLWDGHRLDHYQLAAAISGDYRTTQLETTGAHGELRSLLHVESHEFRTILRSIYRGLLATKQGMAGVNEWDDSASAIYEGQSEACLGFAFLCRVGNITPERLVTVGMHGVCYDGLQTNRRHDEVVDAMKTALINLERPVSFTEMRGWLTRIEPSEEFLRRCIAVSRDIGFMKGDMVGLRASSYFAAHSLHEMARAALTALNEPAHYEKIAHEIERLYPERAPVNALSVYHALAVHKDEFVLAKHGGIYGLPEWPTRAVDSLKDYLSDFLRQKGGRASRQELLSAAEEKGYKAASVSTILYANRSLFRRVAWGQWELAR